jgi:hypothetical protein
MESLEPETQAFATLAEFCQRFWSWARASVDYETLRQACFSERMMNSDSYPYRALNALTIGLTAPRWTQVEDAMFDGIRPYRGDEADRPEFNAGLFVHGLYAHCAP